MRLIKLLILAFLVWGCSQTNNTTSNQASSNVSANASVEITRVKSSQSADSIWVQFKIMNALNKKEKWGAPDTSAFRIRELKINNPAKMVDIREYSGEIPQDIMISLMIDNSKTISYSDMEQIEDAVRLLIDSFPPNSIYVSFFNTETTESRLTNKDNFSQLKPFFTPTNQSKKLYKSIMQKFAELAFTEFPNVNSKDFNQQLLEVAKNDSVRKYLILLTDGREDIYQANYWQTVEQFDQLVKSVDANPAKKIEIRAIQFGNQKNIDDNDFRDFCVSGRRDDVKGDFYSVKNAAQIVNSFSAVQSELQPDYEFLLINEKGKIYSGQSLEIEIKIEKNGKIAYGKRNFAIGSPTGVIVTGNEDSAQNYLIGLAIGLILLLIIYFIFQVLIPLIKYKNFCNKNVIKYQPQANVSAQQCFYCGRPFEFGDEIVTKCSHIVHKKCWEKNDNKCPEYGLNCKTGSYYYNKENKLDPKNAPKYVKWIVWGMLGGVISWFLYFFTLSQCPTLGHSLIKGLVSLCYPNFNLEQHAEILFNFQAKIQGLLLSGIILGFILTFLFYNILEFRKKDFKIVSIIVLRAIVGALLGWIAFLLGSMLIILFKANTANLFVDWIPWLLFGSLMGLALSFKSEIEWKRGLIGGAIAVLFGFIILYSAIYLFVKFTILVTFLLYSAILGGTIAVAHGISQKYFLELSGKFKKREIAIHKWMSAVGGLNKVTIGKSINCVIQMNWDNVAEHEVYAELYIFNDRPHCRAVETGVFYENHKELPKGKAIPLVNGTKFEIGETIFTYVERDI